MEGSVAFGRRCCGRSSRSMTRCECTAVPFDEIVRRLRAGQSLDEAQAETGAGLLCTACVPDLRAHLAAADAADEAGAEAATDPPGDSEEPAA